MRQHRIDVQDNPCMKNPMGITCHEEDVTISFYMSGTIVCSNTLSLTQQQLENCPQIVLTSPYNLYPHSDIFPKGSHSEEEEYLSDGIAKIRIYALRSKVHETKIETELRDTIYELSLIATILVSQVIIANAKVSDATRITDLDEGVFEVQRQGIPSHRTFTSKDRH